MRTARSNLVSRIRSLSATLLLVASFLTFAPAAVANQPSQADIEAVYLFDFGKFVRWPAGANQGPISICVAASPSFAAGLQRIVSNENIDGRALEIRHVERPAEASGCAILFLEAAQHLHAEEFLQAVANQPTLTVSDMPDFLSRGGMIQFQLIEKRIRFSINLDGVNRAHLAMSSELLKVAVSVKGKIPDGGAQ